MRRLAGDMALRKFRSPEIARHSLRFGGRIAGFVDEYGPDRIRGWVYDASRPDAILELEILVDGKLARTIRADVYRDDLATLLGDTGLHGFDWIDHGLVPRGESRQVIVRVADRRRYVLAKFEISQGVVDAALLARFEHLADRLSALHEHVTPRFDRLDTALNTMPYARGASAGAEDAASFYSLPVSRISGVGQFGPAQEEATERRLFKARLEDDLRRARLQGDPGATG
jgi:hypothetical protein